MPIGIRPINDFAFKKIFGSPENRNVLISLLNAILELPIPVERFGAIRVKSITPFGSAIAIQAGFWGKHWRFTLWNWSGTI
jgi:hypothetical protein